MVRKTTAGFKQPSATVFAGIRRHAESFAIDRDVALSLFKREKTKKKEVLSRYLLRYFSGSLSNLGLQPGQQKA